MKEFRRVGFQRDLLKIREGRSPAGVIYHFARKSSPGGSHAAVETEGKGTLTGSNRSIQKGGLKMKLVPVPEGGPYASIGGERRGSTGGKEAFNSRCRGPGLCIKLREKTGLGRGTEEKKFGGLGGGKFYSNNVFEENQLKKP